MNLTIRSVFLGLFIAVVLPAQADEWQNTFTPYLWMANMKITAGSDAFSATSEQDFFDDVLPLTDAGWMSMFEARKGNWSVMNDIQYMKISDSARASGPLGFMGANLEAVFAQGLIDLMVGYTADHSQTTWYTGLRYIFLDVSVDMDITAPPAGSVAKGGNRYEYWVDPVIGVRHTIPFNEQFSATIQMDVGGGLDSEFSSVSTATLNYALSDSATLRAGYRYGRIDKDDSELLFDDTIDGFLVAVGFVF